MSSILKALEKVERERAARRDGIPLELLAAQKKQRSPWLLPGGVLLGAAAAALITFAAMGGFARPTAVNRVVAPAGPASAASQPPQARPVQVVTKPASAEAPRESLPAPAPAAAARFAARGPAVAHPYLAVTKVKPSLIPRLNAIAAPPQPVKAKTPHNLAAVIAPATPVAAPLAAPESPAPSAAAPLGLKVSGIVVQSGDESFAIVNGRPVPKGGTVEGVRVEEILSDRVKFSGGGRHFDVSLGEESR